MVSEGWEWGRLAGWLVMEVLAVSMCVFGNRKRAAFVRIVIARILRWAVACLFLSCLFFPPLIHSSALFLQRSSGLELVDRMFYNAAACCWLLGVRKNG